jgi:hypothetical protein
MILVLVVSSVYSVSAQSDVVNTMDNKDDNEKYRALDNILNPTISATLTGLSLTGGTFLVNLTRNTSETVTNHIHIARKSFIKAFFMFLICTILLFVFDFIEILDEKNILTYIILDVIITYILFGIGAWYLVNAAKQLYGVYGR